MNSSFRNKLILVAGLIAAMSLPGIAAAGERDKYSLKYQAHDRMEHRSRVEHGDRHNYRRYNQGHRDDRHRHGHRRDRHEHAYNHHRGHRNGHHARHRHHRDDYWWHRQHGHHDYRHYQHHRRHGHYEGLRINGLYLTPNVGLSIDLGL